MPLTNKQLVKHHEPKATLDYYESLRNSGKPCWFIRDGLQGAAYTGICKSPKVAWKEAADGLRLALAKGMVRAVLNRRRAVKA